MLLSASAGRNATFALADRWTSIEASGHRSVSPFAGAEDLNSEAATALEGVLFMEGDELADVMGDANGSSGTTGWPRTCSPWSAPLLARAA